MRTLKNAFASGRIAQAYMLTGVRGVGKTTTARLIARALNYEAPGVDGPTLDIEAEGVHCRAILESRHLDVVEMDAASHTGIDDIRELIDSATTSPTSPATRSTSSTRCTCCRSRPSPACSRRWKSRPSM